MVHKDGTLSRSGRSTFILLPICFRCASIFLYDICQCGSDVAGLCTWSPLSSNQSPVVTALAVQGRDLGLV
jgi:hypothetical protein